MGSKHEPVLSFDRSSPVLAYWLAHCEGFGVRMTGGKRGVVEAVGFESPDQPRMLVVRLGLLSRRRLIPVQEVEAVLPAKQLLLVSRRPGHARLLAARGGRHARRFATTAPPVAARLTVAAGRGLAAAVERILFFLAEIALALARGSRRVGRTGSAAFGRAAPFVRRGAISAAWTFRLAATGAAAAIRRGAARVAVALRTGGRRGGAAASRFGAVAAPRARSGAERAVRAAEGVNSRLEGPLLRLHRRFASEQDLLASSSAPEPLLPRSFRPPVRSERRRGSPTRSTSRRSS